MRNWHLIAVAVIMSSLWVGLSQIYDYKFEDVYFLGLNLFPLVLWIIGLLLTRKIYDTQTGKNRFITLLVLYWVGLIAIEAIGYHVLNIQLNSNYPGLFGLDVIHTPVYAQAYYLLAGPIFVALTLRLEGKEIK